MKKPLPTNTKTVDKLHYDDVMNYLVSQGTISEQEKTDFWRTYGCEYVFDGSETVEHDFSEDLEEMNEAVAEGETDDLREPHRKVFEALVDLYGEQEYRWYTSW